jgi:hypothetical protein
MTDPMNDVTVPDVCGITCIVLQWSWHIAQMQMQLLRSTLYWKILIAQLVRCTRDMICSDSAKFLEFELRRPSRR